MAFIRHQRESTGRLLALLGLGGAWAAACGGPQPLGSSGSICFRPDDCQPGLECVQERAGSSKHVCSGDLSGIVPMADGAAAEAEAPLGAGRNGSSGSTSGGVAGSGSISGAGPSSQAGAGGRAGGTAMAGSAGSTAGAALGGAASGGASATAENAGEGGASP